MALAKCDGAGHVPGHLRALDVAWRSLLPTRSREGRRLTVVTKMVQNRLCAPHTESGTRKRRSHVRFDFQLGSANASGRTRSAATGASRRRSLQSYGVTMDALARASFQGLTEADRRQVTRRLLDESEE
jgi:hypothetical protein